MRLTDKDERILSTVHPDLVRVIRRAAMDTDVPFRVLEGVRSPAAQRRNIAKGVSWTMRSRHLPSKDGKARAVDIAPIDNRGQVLWAWPVYHKLAPEIKRAAEAIGIPVEWGGDWKKTKDGPHWQLPWKAYP